MQYFLSCDLSKMEDIPAHMIEKAILAAIQDRSGISTISEHAIKVVLWCDSSWLNRATPERKRK
jgi:hypothetical protein